MKSHVLQDRLSNFAVKIISVADKMSKTKAGNHLANQILRSGTSPALNYAEAQGAESKKDFIHKMRIVLKELRETYVCLGIIQKAVLYENVEDLAKVIAEANELVSIFVASTKTAEKSLAKR